MADRAPITSLAGLCDEAYLTLKDVASVLRVGPTKAYELVVGGQIEFIRIGKRIRVEVRALRAFIAQNRRGGATRSPQSFINVKKRAG